ncbi:hypothetical protein FI667_g13600, partial [Globisporangium splendens]
MLSSPFSTPTSAANSGGKGVTIEVQVNSGLQKKMELTEAFSAFLPMNDHYDRDQFFVRACYPEYYDLITKKPDGRVKLVTVTGTPGIGKSVFYVYFFLRYSESHPDATITLASFADRGDLENFVIWTNQEVQTGRTAKRSEMTRMVHEAEVKAEQENRPYIRLYDGPPRTYEKHIRTVCFTSLRDEWLNMVTKNQLHIPFFMPLWDLDELEDAAVALNLGSSSPDPVDLPTIADRFDFFGGVAQFCLVDGDSDLNEHKWNFKNEIRKITTDLNTLNDLMADEGEEKLYHQLCHCVPDPDALYDYSIKVASRMAALMVLEQISMNLVGRRDNLALVLRSVRGAKALNGHLFEGRAHEKLARGVSFAAKRLCEAEAEESDVRARTNVEIIVESSREYFNYDDSFSLSSVLFGGPYHVRMYLRDTSGARLLLSLAAPTATTHPVNGDGIIDVLSRLRLADVVSADPDKAALIFVVPKAENPHKRPRDGILSQRQEIQLSVVNEKTENLCDIPLIVTDRKREQELSRKVPPVRTVADLERAIGSKELPGYEKYKYQLAIWQENHVRQTSKQQAVRMEEFFQYVGRSQAASVALTKHKLFLYASPRENPIDRCGEVRVGAYFACSDISFYGDQCWMKIRRGVFSNAKLNGYIRVEFDLAAQDAGDVPPHQQTNIAEPRPAQFKYLRRLPNFPAFLCAREKLLLSRIPVFSIPDSSKKSFSSADSPSHTKKGPHRAHQLRYLPSVSVFHATEAQFNEDFTQMALKISSTFGMAGWINVSFHDTLIVVEDPRPQNWSHPVYMQNVATKTGKLMGELPFRAIPSLQAPRLGSIESHRIVEAVERKLVKDQVWIKIRNCETPVAKKADDGDIQEEDTTDTSRDGDSNVAGDLVTTTTDADKVRTKPSEVWIIERNVNTGERVTIPWGASAIQDRPNTDREERYYRNIYSRRALPLRKNPELAAEVVGQLEPGVVFASSMRVLNAQGRMWIRVPLSNDENPQDTAFGYAIQSNAKTNRCMLQEIPAPGKMSPTQYFQVVCSPQAVANSQNNSEPNQDDGAQNVVAARSEPTMQSKELFYVKNGTIVSVLGSMYVREERRIWLQVLATDIDNAMRVKQDKFALTEDEQHQNVVYLPVCDPSRPFETAVKPINRVLVKIPNPNVHSNEKKPSARVIFSGRASKLFGSQLMQPSTIDLASFRKSGDALSSSSSFSSKRAAAAAGETQSPAQSLKDEINSWQLESEHLSTISTYVYGGLSYATECLKRPFSSCLAKKAAMRQYDQLYQQDDDDDLEYGEVPEARA